MLKRKSNLNQTQDSTSNEVIEQHEQEVAKSENTESETLFPTKNETEIDYSFTHDNVGYSGVDSELREKPSRRKNREFKWAMTKGEYREYLNELNDNAENKNFVIFFGVPECGKSYIIASLLHYMRSFPDGNMRLNKDIATEFESDLFNRMSALFAVKGGDGNIRTPNNEFFQLNIIYEPSSNNKKPVEMTFLDASGENLRAIYEKSGDEIFTGKLPDFIEAILESDVHAHLVFVYDKSWDKPGPPQVEILKSMYDKMCEIQEKHDKVYPKLLLLSKSDKISENVKKKYGHSAYAYANSVDSGLRTFANGFFNEKGCANRAIFYQMGTFSKYDDLEKFDSDSPHRLFNWLYRNITNDDVLVPETLWQRFIRWLFGK